MMGTQQAGNMLIDRSDRRYDVEWPESNEWCGQFSVFSLQLAVGSRAWVISGGFDGQSAVL
jgi:hypothetical protein